MSIPRNLPDQMADLYFRIAEIERRGRNRRRTGTVEEIGEGERSGQYRVKLAEAGDKPFMTGWIKPRTLGAGGVKIDVLLAKGEQVDVTSESGDMTDAIIDLSTYSEAHARENSDVPLHIKIGETTIAVKGDEVVITAAKGHLA